MANKRLFEYYAKLPVCCQHLACSLAGISIRRRRYSSVFHDALRFLRDSQWWSLEEQTAYQDAQVRKVVLHAYETVPYYRELFDGMRLKPRDIASVSGLKKLPVLSKATVRERYKDLQSKDWPSARQRFGSTGGTTGTALRLIWDVDTQPWQWAVWWRHRERFGLKLHDPYISFAGREVVPLTSLKPPIWRRNFPMHRTYVSVHHMTTQNMEALARYLNKRRVQYYSGYPSGIYLIARYFLDHGIRLRYPPQVVATGAETLLPHHQQVIGNAFGATVTDQYGASEQCGNMSQCEHHKYHVDMEFGVVEFEPLKGMPDNLRRVVCTGFRNYAMPLLRYDIGDIAAISEGNCRCGREAPCVDKIDGRIESYIITPDGRQLGRLDFLFKASPHIEEAQLVQETGSTVIVNVVKGKGYNSRDEMSLMSDLRRFLGAEIVLKIEYLSEIPRERNGKFRQIVSRVFRDKYANIQE